MRDLSSLGRYLPLCSHMSFSCICLCVCMCVCVPLVPLPFLERTSVLLDYVDYGFSLMTSFNLACMISCSVMSNVLWPLTVAFQAPLSMKFFRQEYWSVLPVSCSRDSPSSSVVKNPPVVHDTWIKSLGWEYPLEKEMATHSSILAWETPWTRKPGRLGSMGSQESWTQLSD